MKLLQTTLYECEHYSGALAVDENGELLHPPGQDVLGRLATDALLLHHILTEPDDIPQAPDPGPSIYAEIRAERLRQDEKWGGPEHDDQHTRQEWRRITLNNLAEATGMLYRKQLIRVAALAVAAIEAYDRKNRQ